MGRRDRRAFKTSHLRAPHTHAHKVAFLSLSFSPLTAAFVFPSPLFPLLFTRAMSSVFRSLTQTALARGLMVARGAPGLFSGPTPRRALLTVAPSPRPSLGPRTPCPGGMRRLYSTGRSSGDSADPARVGVRFREKGKEKRGHPLFPYRTGGGAHDTTNHSVSPSYHSLLLGKLVPSFYSPPSGWWCTFVMQRLRLSVHVRVRGLDVSRVLSASVVIYFLIPSSS